MITEKPDWHTFVMEHGTHQRVYQLAHIVEQPEAEVSKVMHGRGRSWKRRKQTHKYADLFAMWRGRAPQLTDDSGDWPAPRPCGKGAHEWDWLPPELALLGRLVGRENPQAIVDVLTARLRRLTGDPTACRTRMSVQNAVQRMGLQFRDIVGGLTIREAALEIDGVSPLYRDIAKGTLPAKRIGQHLVIARADFDAWKAARVYPPKGFVPLASLKPVLGIKSDKLPWYASLGHIPTAMRCNPTGTRGPSTKFGTWWIDGAVAKKLISDRKRGLPMPWHGKADPGNLAMTYRKWRKRQHPIADCESCQHIWGKAGPPATLEDFSARYPALDFGAKRHLTFRWHPGLRPRDIERLTGESLYDIQRALRNGTLQGMHRRGRWVVTRTACTAWKDRGCPIGLRRNSTMAQSTACHRYGFSPAEIRKYLADGTLTPRPVKVGPNRGDVFVGIQQVADLRAKLGYTREAAARRLKVTPARLAALLRGLEWRGDQDRVPLTVLSAAAKRKATTGDGLTIKQAARLVDKSPKWVLRALRLDARARTARLWNLRDFRVSAVQLARLKKTATIPDTIAWSREWITVQGAVLLSGVSQATIWRWHQAGRIRMRVKNGIRRYHRRSIIARARQYWTKECRFKRPTARPAWLRAA